MGETFDKGFADSLHVPELTMKAAVVCLAMVIGAHALGQERNPDGVAVIVGNRNYSDDRVPEVTYAHRDADAFKRYVLDIHGFDEDNIIDLRDATQAELMATFGNDRGYEGSMLWRYLDPGGRSDVVVYYSGHGVPGLEDRKGYLLPVDANPDTVRLNGYPIDWLYANLGGLTEAASVQVYLDACFSGGSDAGMLIRAASPVFVQAALPDTVTESMSVLTAALGDQVASWDESARHGLFTHHLLDALYGKADGDADGQVTALEAKQYLDRHLTRAARRTFGRVQQASLMGATTAVLSFGAPAGFPGRPDLAKSGPRPQSFTVLTEPAGARVRILNIAERYRPGIELPPGEYRAEASAEGYETVVEVVRHGSAEATEHRMVLRRAARQWTRGELFRDCSDCPQMVVIPAGRFRMGCVSGQNCSVDEKPVHDVRIGSAFALSVHEVTFAAWDACVSDGGCGDHRPDDEGWGRGRRPAVNVSWTDARAYVSWLSRKSGEAYRLPSESEWEYAARAGSTTKYHFGNAESSLCGYGNHADSSTDYSRRNQACSDGIGKMTAPVGSYAPNAFGLHDMHGNVWEWTEDCWNGTYAGAPAGGSAWLSGDCTRRVLRGGSWLSSPGNLRAANRDRNPTGYRSSSLGFRVARTLIP